MGVIPKPYLMFTLPSLLVPSLSDPAADKLVLEDLSRRENDMPGEPAREMGGENNPESS
jgi:hypothetical protein